MDQGYQVTTIAGNGEKGFKDGNALEAMFKGPTDIYISKNGTKYVVDQMNHRIRILHNDQVTTIAGNGEEGFKDGNALEAMFNAPTDICCSNDGRLYVTDRSNNRIRMIYNYQVTTIAGNGQEGFKDGNALEAMFRQPLGLCISNDGRLYVAEYDNDRIRMIYNQQVTTIAGNGEKGFKDGNALEAMFKGPTDICCPNNGRLYVVDNSNHRVRMIYDNQVTTIAGNGQQGFKDGKTLEAMFSYPSTICCSKDGRLYVSDQINHGIRMIYNNQVTTIAGNGEDGFEDGNALEAMFSKPWGISCSDDGSLYLADRFNDRIRMIYNHQHQIPTFGFALLLDMQNTFCDCQISFNNITYHLHRVLINVRCPLLLDQSYFSLLQQSNISNESFESFVNFLYSNKLTKERNQRWPRTISIKMIIELIFVFDLLMDCRWMMTELKTRFGEELIEILTANQQEEEKEEESTRKLILKLLPYMYNLRDLIRTKPCKSNMTTKISCLEHCYNELVVELQQRRSIITQYLAKLHHHLSCEVFVDVVKDLMSDMDQTEPTDDESNTVLEFELAELCKLAFKKTNICSMDDEQTNLESSSMSTQDLNAWTRPDFVIKLCDDDISYHVHKLILCGRWKYFCSMIESGLKESKDNEMTLSDDWNKSRFVKFMKYIYLNEIDFDELDDIAWLMKNRILYRIIHDENEDDKIYNAKAAYGFESLYEHCIGVLDQPLTLSNCLSLYVMFEDIGIQSFVKKSFNFISSHLLLLMREETTRNEMQNIVEKDKIVRLFFAHFNNKQ